jgi:hypothetical protein
MSGADRAHDGRRDAGDDFFGGHGVVHRGAAEAAGHDDAAEEVGGVAQCEAERGGGAVSGLAASEENKKISFDFTVLKKRQLY